MVKYELGYVKGADGNGIVSVVKTATVGLVDTYTITFSDGSTTTFQVRNGEDGSSQTIDSSLSTTSVNAVQNKVITGALNGKASSSHSHSIGDVSSLQSSLDGKSDTGHTHTKSNITDFAHTHDDRYYTETETDNLLSGKASSSHTHTKSEITDFPTIPTKTSDLTNDGDGSNVFVKDNDNRLNDNRNPLSNKLNPTSTNPVDLNNVRGTGFYYALGNVNIQYVSNLPSDWGNISFYLTVEETHDANYCKQTITSYNGGKMFVRGRVGGTWGVWKSYLSSDNIVDNLTSTSSTSVLSARQGKVLSDLIGDAITFINGTGGS